MLEYLKKHILEEIEGAEDYMAKAIELKETSHGPKFYDMAMMELSHANCMTKMLNSLEKSKTVSDADYAKTYKDILEAYTTSMGKLEAMKKLYWS